MSSYAKDVLVDMDWVERHLGDPSIRIVEVDENRSLYNEAHIPGAIGLDWQSDLQDRVRREFLGPGQLGALLGSKGISDQHTIVLYGDRNNWFAASAYWYLAYYGHTALKLIDGPREKWIGEGRPMSSDIPMYPPATFTAKPADESIRARRDDVLAAVGRGARLVDVRSPQEFSGGSVPAAGDTSEGVGRGGHVPGAASVPWAQAVKEDGSFKSREDLEAIYGAKGVLTGDPIIAYCLIGERSAHTWFVLHELLGRDDVRNYDGAWTERGDLVDVAADRT